MITTTQNITMANAITHAGTFHSDEVLSTVILEKVFSNLTIIRTLEVPENIGEDVIVYDIGFGKYDHHQKGGNGKRENGVPYASVGLIWKEFGHKIVTDTCNPTLVWEIIEQDLIQGVDAIDNGSLPKADYPIQAMTFSKAISEFNPTWDSQEDADEAFLKAVTFAKIVFDNTLKNAIAKAKAQEIVETAIEKSEGHIMVLDQHIPWQDFILLSQNKKAADILFVVYPSNRGGYNWQCVPDAIGSFGQRKSVPDEWKGLSGTKLQEITGIQTASFCHPNGFIGGADNLCDAIAIAKIAVKS